jgi:hypothetical protein
VEAYQRYRYDGIGIVLTVELGLTGVDFDDAYNGTPQPWALEAVDNLSSYTEVSPSGRGLRVFLWARKPGPHCKNGHVEIYDNERFLTVTGCHLAGTPRTIERRQTQLESVYTSVFAHRIARDARNNGNHDRPAEPLDLADEEIVKRASAAANGAKFSRLWSGDWKTDYQSQSEADLALCLMLAFWTGRNAAQVDALFRSSGLWRPKWDTRRGDSTYGAWTVAEACRRQTETYQPKRDTQSGRQQPNNSSRSCSPMPPTSETADQKFEQEDRASIQAESYVYTSPCPADHYLTRWIKYAGTRTDAAHEYHEAAALVLLASGTPNVRARLAPYPRGLPTNLYTLLIGDSTTSRKSTSESFARDAQGTAIPGSLCADHFSPEGFVEQLAGRSADSTTLYIDEFGELLGKLHHAKHMAGLRGLLLTVYGGEDYTYRRHSKRSKSGIKLEDQDQIERPHLSILGATTPAIFDTLLEQDVTCGLLPRFGIVMPETKPSRRPFFEIAADTEREREDLLTWLRRLHEWSSCEPRSVIFLSGVLARIDSYAAEIERDCGNPRITETAKAMLQRLTAATVKVAMLVAAGHPNTTGKKDLDVTSTDADAAIRIARRWQRDALRFAARIGESDFERTLQRCLRLVQLRGRVRRGIVAMTAHVDCRTLDTIRDTLADRELVMIVVPKTGGRSGELWCAPGNKE